MREEIRATDLENKKMVIEKKMREQREEKCQDLSFPTSLWELIHSCQNFGGMG